MMLRLRERARERFDELGWPTRRTPGYGYVASRHFPARSDEPDPSAAIVLSELPDGVIALPLDEALRTYGTFLRARWNRGLKDEVDPLAAFNGASHGSALFLYLPAAMRASLLIDQRAHTRLHIFVGAGSQLELKLSREVTGWANSYVDVAVEENAHAQLSLQTRGCPRAPLTEAVRATVKGGGILQTTSFSQGAQAHRQDYRVALVGERANAQLCGAWIVDSDASMHTHVLVEHRAPNCTSTQLFKGALRGTARSSFAGKIFVDQQAQGTDAVQMNHNILLSDAAMAASQPDLEIFADDVKCTHGSTTGQLDRDAHLYLRTRGISSVEARRLLVRAFLQDAVIGGIDENSMLQRIHHLAG